MPIDYGYGVYLDTIDRAANFARDWRNNPAVYRTCRQVGLISQHDQDKWFNWQAENKQTRMYSICDPNSIVILGVCGLTSINHINQNAEYSLYIAPEFQGKHFAKPALKTLVKHGFDDLNLHRIWGEVFEGHEKSLAIAKSLGFQEEGFLRDTYYKQGKFIGSHIMALIKPV